ncbi:MAG: methyltransferase domain-containing protein [Candidatus Thermoplasmatota archaeon]|nr:methyltransferase domain-containing protein [Euryarchaeota archaeon]MBU4033082.1 methyltransferase domain-containing protein [Candidatus Thermoplasmatota archaeon]MBU4070703.1 methyltransferase domain-containing protein [Candidatus Thermoplasmatota archaeon]MBU4143364.1 methyltransferase domain-containing protein [Candidatus Thermoplasmatota archaeon]MBU4591190.1 methyltransferase domain-containing protein [Candidatus Thermoplasmatota archaeon]
MVRKERVRKKYDRWSRFYDAFDLGGVNDQKKLAVDLLELSQDSLVLDIGTGTGAIIPYLASKLGKNGKVIGIDFSEQMIERANVRIKKQGIGSKAEARVADATAMEYPDRHFDAALATFAFTSFPEPEKAIAEAARVLKPGARFSVLDTGKPPGKAGFRYRYLKAVMWRAGYTNISLDVPGLLRKSSFKIIKLHRFSGSFAYICLCEKT